MDESQSEVATFGQRLRAVRSERGVSRHDLAIRADMLETEVGRYERGGREPRLTTILRLARGLGVLPGELLDPLA